MGFKIPGSDIKAGIVAIAASTNFPAGTNPQVLSGSVILMDKIAPGSLSAVVTVLPQTNTLTAYAKWQVSEDNSTWVDVVPANNAANVVIATGTSGTDTATTVCMAANEALYAHKYARIQLYTGVTSSTTGDLGSAKYYYRENVRF
jgi:hypothetical protein